MQPSAWPKVRDSAPLVNAGKIHEWSTVSLTMKGQRMNDWTLKRSIHRWESEGGALLPRDCNVHFWNHRMVLSGPRFAAGPAGPNGTYESDALTEPILSATHERRD